MKRGSTVFLQTVLALIGAGVLFLCYSLIRILLTEQTGGYFPILLVMLTAAIPFYIALFHVMKLLSLSNSSKIFSDLSVQSLTCIKYCTFSISTLYAVSLPYIFIVADRDDAPGVVLLGLIFTFAPLLVGVCAAILQRLLQNAIQIKSENELAV